MALQDLEHSLNEIVDETVPSVFASRFAKFTCDCDRLGEHDASAIADSGIIQRAISIAVHQYRTVPDDTMHQYETIESLARGIYRLFVNKTIIRTVATAHIATLIEIALGEIPKHSSPMSLDGRRDLSNVLTRLFVARRRDMSTLIASVLFLSFVIRQLMQFQWIHCVGGKPR